MPIKINEIRCLTVTDLLDRDQCDSPNTLVLAAGREDTYRSPLSGSPSHLQSRRSHGDTRIRESYRGPGQSRFELTENAEDRGVSLMVAKGARPMVVGNWEAQEVE